MGMVGLRMEDPKINLQLAAESSASIPMSAARTE